MKALPNFTAFLVARTLLALYRSGRSELVAKPQADHYALFVKECRAYGGAFRLVAHLPDRVVLFILDKIIVSGMSRHYACRKRVIATETERAIAAGIKQLVVVGGGFDLLTMGMAEANPPIHAIEIDHPDTQRVKRLTLEKHDIAIMPNCYFVAADLSQQSLKAVLEPLFKPGVPTLFILEGITMYLTEAENQTLFADMKTLGATRVIFTGIDKLDDGEDRGEHVRHWFLKRRKEQFRWAKPYTEMNEFLTGAGFKLVAYQRYAELQRSFLSLHEYDALDQKNGEHVYIAQSLS